jgi:hypothetical protein
MVDYIHVMRVDQNFMVEKDELREWKTMAILGSS